MPGSLSGGPPLSPSPTRSPSPSPSVSPLPSGQTGPCTAAYRAVNTRGGGFHAEVTVRNSGTASLNGWTVRMTLGSGQTITNLWNGQNTGSSGAISVRNAPYNGALAPNGTTTFGYVANGNGATVPTAVTCTSP